ncbi:hypothetical protein HYC85_026797 [Camellia sinensis]|uniref:Sugar phosphate transporter domain-containing protein n=1 Tax=Camellia sinensis TaxID=4442 RepID=A0A7J7G893_CAMSI|nr:hypothetical protein HYC85_026797 [Camellia sinensis]
MIESDSDTERDKITEHNYNQKRSQESSLPREPSFSGWCDEDGVFHTDDQLENVDLIEDFHFELPLLQQGGLEKGHLDGEMNGENDKDGVPTHDVRNANGKYVAFDIENVSEREQNFSNLGENGSNSMDNHGASHSHRKSAISAIDVMKTLFFILVWYTFSTILTLYNKTLLGDDLGKFPAPLLMNTFHFAMQAVLSTAITWFWPQRFQPRVTMSWKDYFMRVVPTALGTALDINLSNASLVFISVTFATMCKSAAPIFLLIFAFAFRLESPSFKLFGIIFIISIGIMLTVAKETEFEFWGFIFVMLAAVMSGFRWTMTQILLQVTVTIAGVVKEAVTILVAVFYFHDQFTWLKGAGLITILFGVSLFNWYKPLTDLALLSKTTALHMYAITPQQKVTSLVLVPTRQIGIGPPIPSILDLVGWFQPCKTWDSLPAFAVTEKRYQKLQKGEIGEENVARSLTTNPAAKYVILEEMDDQDDGPWELGLYRQDVIRRGLIIVMLAQWRSLLVVEKRKL